MNRLSFSIASVLIATIAVTATAQQSEIATLPVSPHPADQTVHLWDTVVHDSNREQFVVLTIAEPGVRHNCHVKSISEKELLCAGKFGHTTSYQAGDIAVLLNPGMHDRIWPWVVGLLGTGGGLIAAACFVASLWAAVPLAILGTLLILMSPLAGIGAADYPETVYYQRSDAALSVNLR